jgi:hypothetical protein
VSADRDRLRNPVAEFASLRRRVLGSDGQQQKCNNMAVQNRDALWATGHDETVEVNQRALIDKVLARYSGEFTGESPS